MPSISTRFVRPIAFAAAIVIAGTAATTAQSREKSVVDKTSKSPLLGAWELDLTRMPQTYGTPPKRVVYTFEDLGAGQWRTTIDITAPDDSVRHTTVTYLPDGKTVRGEGDTVEADKAAVVAPAPNVLVMNLAKDKVRGSVRTYTVSADGKELIEAAANVDTEGNPYIRRFYYKRIR